MVVGAPRSKCTDTLVPDTTLFRSNVKDDVDTILIQLHHLRINCCRETALTPVQLDNAGNVSPYLGPRKNLTRRQLDFRLNFFVLQPLVALQHNAVDDGIFLYLNREIALDRKSTRLNSRH